MTTFKPTFGVFKTFLNTYTFIKNHDFVFWDLLKRVGPYIIAISLISTLYTHSQLKEIIDSVQNVAGDGATDINPEDLNTQNVKSLGNNILLVTSISSILISYFMTVFAVSWHRLVLLGKDKYEPMNPLKPQKHEIMFLVMGMVIGLIAFLPAIPIMLLGALLGPFVLVTIPITFFIVIFLSIRFSFYLPAKAIDRSLTLSEAFKLSKGYAWKFFLSSILCLAPIILIYGINGLSSGFDTISSYKSSAIMTFIFQIPSVLLIQPLAAIVGVTVLSNYYQHALQNGKGE